MSFPAGYPFSPPLVTFYTDIFHPLLTPLTTATFSSVGSDSDSEGTAVQEALPPGAFHFRHGFPRWYNKGSTEKLPSSDSSMAASGRDTSPNKLNRKPHSTAEAGKLAKTEPSTNEIIHIVDILRYMRQSFELVSVLDSVPFEAAGNPGAWYAWRAYRQKQQEKERQEATEPATPKGHARTPSKAAHGRTSSRGVNRSQGDTPGRPKKPSEWNWEGVWEQRVKRAIQDSVSEGTLFGAGGDSEIAFLDVKLEEMGELRTELMLQLRLYD